MKRRLFLTGPIGCGKSTAIRTALGEKLPRCGGFLTLRHRQPQLHFTLTAPNGKDSGTFLDFSAGRPQVDLAVFASADLSGEALVLDEIGGIELLNPAFRAMLDDALARNVPILGVLKAESSAAKLANALALSETYTLAARSLWDRLLSDPDTLIFQCGQFDETALTLAREWREEYLHD